MASAPAWSIPQGRRSTAQSNESLTIPGPGTYDHLAIKRRTPTWKIGTSTRNSFTKDEMPGPGAYDSPGKISKGTPKYHFAGKYVLSEKEINPGPGAYDVRRDTEPKLRGYTIQSRSSIKDVRSDSPGPAAYDQNSSVVGHRSAIAKIGKSKRNSIAETRDSPGPGAYNIDISSPSATNLAPKWGFGTEVRKGLASLLKSTPGPGSYTYSNLFNNPNKGAFIVPRRQDGTESFSAGIPGPAAYNPPLATKKRAPVCRIGTATRESYANRRLSTPGPGNYESSTPNKHKGIKIGTSVRTPIHNRSSTPGPGAYTSSPTKADGPKCVIIPRRPDTAENVTGKITPGPGAYTPSVDLARKSMPAVRIGSSTRVDLNISGEMPGPGAYNLRGKQDGPQWRFGNEQRDKDRAAMNKSTEPGPASYDIPTKFADVPKYALPMRRKI